MLVYSFDYFILFLDSDFGIRVIVASQNELGSILTSVFWKRLCNINISL